jgi:hypothetical protein
MVLWRGICFLVLFQILESTRLYLNIVTSHQKTQRLSTSRPPLFDSRLIDFTNCDCFLQFVGYIETILEDEIFWITGPGFLSIKNDQNSQSISSNCSYVTVTGVEANHQMVRNGSLLSILFSCILRTIPTH